MTSEVILRAGMASDAIGCNMHMDPRVIKVAGFKSEVKLDL